MNSTMNPANVSLRYQLTSEAAFGPSRHPMVLGRLLGRVVVNGGLSEVRPQGGWNAHWQSLQH